MVANGCAASTGQLLNCKKTKQNSKNSEGNNSSKSNLDFFMVILISYSNVYIDLKRQHKEHKDYPIKLN